MAIFLVGHMVDDKFVPCDVSEDMSTPQLGGVYVGGGAVREVVGIMDDGEGVLMGELDDEVIQQALKHTWDTEDPHLIAGKDK